MVSYDFWGKKKGGVVLEKWNLNTFYVYGYRFFFEYLIFFFKFCFKVKNNIGICFKF